jgi:hypothetical protein
VVMMMTPARVSNACGEERCQRGNGEQNGF